MPPTTPDDADRIARWHFAVGGLDSHEHSFPVAAGGVIRLDRLTNFPTEEELRHRLSSLPVAGVMAQYGAGVVRHELVIDAERFADHTDRIFPTAEAVLAGLRIRTGAEVVCPAVAARSWAALPPHCPAFHFERGYAHHAAATPRLLLADDIDWVRANLGTVVTLSDHDGFQTAVEALCTYMLAASDRMKVAQLWAGLEAVFDVEYELRYRLSTLVARLLAPLGKECRDTYTDVKALYGERSKIIHGKSLVKNDPPANAERVRGHITRVRGLLARVLTRLIELRRVPTAEEFEVMIFDP